MIITIDGPAASGKSTIAHLLAHQLGCMYVNSGLLYRAVAYAYTQKMIDSLSREALCELFSSKGKLRYRLDPNGHPHIYYEGIDITSYLKSEPIDQAASEIAVNAAVRDVLTDYQRAFVKNVEAIVDGRDAGTVVFPDAEYKFYITATPEVRAERWLNDQQRLGNNFSYTQALEHIEKRDTRDKERALAPLLIASDALVIDTSTLTIQEVLGLINDIIGLPLTLNDE